MRVRCPDLCCLRSAAAYSARPYHATATTSTGSGVGTCLGLAPAPALTEEADGGGGGAGDAGKPGCGSAAVVYSM
jgi:hypothetical protein